MKQTDPSDSSPVGITNTHLDSKGYYFANGVNIIPGQNMSLNNITREQAQDILKSEIINYINSEDLIELQKIANQEISNVPVPTRIGQVLTSKVIDGKLVSVWDDLSNVPQTSSEFSTPSDNNDTDADTIEIFTNLINASYTVIDKYDSNNYLTPNDTSKLYGGDLSSYEISFLFKFNSQNESVTFETSTGLDILFKNNFDGTITVFDDLQELVTLDYNEDGKVNLVNGGDAFDVDIGYEDSNGLTDIKPWPTEIAGGRKFTRMIVNGSAATIFYVEPPFE